MNVQYAAPQQTGRGPEMAIGEFGGAPVSGGPVLSNGLYWAYEMGQAALNPARALAGVTQLYFKNPLNPLAHTTYGKSVAAAMELFERSTRRYAKPEWNIDSTMVGGERVTGPHRHRLGASVLPAAAFRAHVCHVPRRAAGEAAHRRADVGPRRHAVAGDGRAFLPTNDVYITDWVDARRRRCGRQLRPLRLHRLRMSMLHRPGRDAHVLGVCQPGSR